MIFRFPVHTENISCFQHCGLVVMVAVLFLQVINQLFIELSLPEMHSWPFQYCFGFVAEHYVFVCVVSSCCESADTRPEGALWCLNVATNRMGA